MPPNTEQAARTESLPLPKATIERIIVPAPPVHVHVHAPERKNSFYDPGVYLPALPGMLVALFGLWAAHALAQRRDKKKAVADLCEALKKMAAEASASAIDAWIEPDGAKRASGIASTKRLLQSAGITATTLKRRTQARWSWQLAKPMSIFPVRLFERRSINLLRDIFVLRQAAMADPFEDPGRGADVSRVDAINAAVSSLIASADRALFDYQG
ncbi:MULTISPECIES: hypothetical protein [Sphingobium]|uniref:hypothetical protein n=1 Tax=Sphingobium TaxID=165695 RepID=UPI000A8F2CA2|nr:MULTISPECIES: hypothetical protein [Sphingobium]MBR2270158.1 hypothetical protein [Sphingobium sp.]